MSFDSNSHLQIEACVEKAQRNFSDRRVDETKIAATLY
jgi:hypothetical protein